MSNPWQGKAVVIVDDSPTVRAELKATYEAIGMRVVGLGATGVEGLDLVSKTSPELVSLDLIMPEMDGVECFRKLRKFFPEVRVVVISWLSAEQKIMENLKEVIPAHLFQPKPVTAEALRQRLSRIYELPVSATSPSLAPVAVGTPLDDAIGAPTGLADLTAKVS